MSVEAVSFGFGMLVVTGSVVSLVVLLFFQLQRGLLQSMNILLSSDA